MSQGKSEFESLQQFRLKVKDEEPGKFEDKIRSQDASTKWIWDDLSKRTGKHQDVELYLKQGKIGRPLNGKRQCSWWFRRALRTTQNVSSSRVVMWRLFAKTWSFGCRLVCRPYNYMVYTVYIVPITISLMFLLRCADFLGNRTLMASSWICAFLLRLDGVKADIVVYNFAFLDTFFHLHEVHEVRKKLCQAIAAIPSTGVEAMWHLAHPKSSRLIRCNISNSVFWKEELFYAISLFMCCWCFPLSINVLCLDFDLGAQAKFLEELRCEALQHGILVPHSVKIRNGIRDQKIMKLEFIIYHYLT